MLDWIKRETVWISSDESIASGKVSVLAVIEVILSVFAYWWIAAAFETHLHILVSLIAAPLVLLRSPASVAHAEKSWEKFRRDKDISPVQLRWIVALSFVISAVAIYLIASSWLTPPISWDLFWRAAVLSVLSIYIAVAVAVAVEAAVAGAGARAVAATATATATATVAGTLAVVVTVVLPSSALGVWLRSILIRIDSVLHYPVDGLLESPSNWRRAMLVDDARTPAYLIPGVDAGIDSRSLWHQRQADAVKTQSLNDRAFDSAVNLILLVMVTIPALCWRYSLKSTCWFYAPIFLISRKNELADTQTRHLHFDAKPTLWFTWRFIFAVIGLLAALFATINWAAAWKLHLNDAPFSPVGWLLVLDWSEFTEQPWQWFSLPAAALTVLIYLWIDSLRKLRDSAKSAGEDPELIASIEHHPGLTIYWLDRIRNGLAIISLIVGLWCFTEWAYFNGTISALEPYMKGVFGPR